MRKYLINRLMVFAVLSVLVVGCASINSDPFAKYANAVQQSQAGIDAAMSINYKWTRSSFINGFASDNDSKFSHLVLQLGSGYGWAGEHPPIYMDVKQTRSALANLNSSISVYANLLLKLAGGSLVNVETFDQLTRDLNENASDALASLNLPAPKNNIAIFSTGAIELARLYIEKKRQKYLIETLEENQSNVQEYSDLCISLIHMIRGTMKSYYADYYEPIKKEWNANTGIKRIKNTDEMLTLNEQFADALRTLQELEEAYSALPQAHADLAKAIKNPKFDMKGIQRLYSSGNRLQRLHKELVKAEK